MTADGFMWCGIGFLAGVLWMVGLLGWGGPGGGRRR